jgi:hypothetical protein
MEAIRPPPTLSSSFLVLEQPDGVDILCCIPAGKGVKCFPVEARCLADQVVVNPKQGGM